MHTNPALKHSGKTFRWAAAGFLSLLILLLISGWRTVVRADREMRAGLLQQTRIAAQAVNIKRIQTLTGTVADLANSEYLLLKEQLAAIRSANLQCRFVYLMGRRTDGTVFFFADSEPSGSADESPAGQVYDE
ncbi:MAG: hypothetical protein WC334_11440, partial [Kiritimatiellales bacterium]